MKPHTRTAAAAASFAVCTMSGIFALAEEPASTAPPAGETQAAETPPAQTSGKKPKWFSVNAYADIESAYVCRGYVWDSRPYSAQSVSAAAGTDELGTAEATVWTMSAMSSTGHSPEMTRYAYAEVDYLLRYYYDIDLVDGFKLRNGVGRQWVTNPGYAGGHTLCDWQALQILQTPWASPYWRMRRIHKPIDETYWIIGAKRSFDLCDKLVFTVDFFGDFGNRRHFGNLYGPKPSDPGSSYRGGLQALNLVFRLDYRLAEHIGIFGFLGQFSLVSDDARDSVKAARGPEMRRDLTYVGVGVSVDF